MALLTPLTASLLAAAVAWLSILAVVHLPAGRLPMQRLRVVGGITIAALGAVVLGAPLPGWAPVGVLLAGGLWVVLRRPEPDDAAEAVEASEAGGSEAGGSGW